MMAGMATSGERSKSKLRRKLGKSQRRKQDRRSEGGKEINSQLGTARDKASKQGNDCQHKAKDSSTCEPGMSGSLEIGGVVYDVVRVRVRELTSEREDPYSRRHLVPGLPTWPVIMRGRLSDPQRD